MNLEPITENSPYFERADALAREAFPPEEYLSARTLAQMARRADFDFWALLEDGAFVGFMAVLTHETMAYLFFLAIEPSRRSMGCGSRAVEALKAAYPHRQQVVDLEMLDPAAPNGAQRARRRAFYLRCGYQETGLFLSYLGVDYEVLCMDDGFSPKAFQAMLGKLRIDGFHPRWFGKAAPNA